MTWIKCSHHLPKFKKLCILLLNDGSFGAGYLEVNMQNVVIWNIYNFPPNFSRPVNGIVYCWKEIDATNKEINIEFKSWRDKYHKGIPYRFKDYVD